MSCDCKERVEAVVHVILKQVIMGCKNETQSMIETLKDIIDSYEHKDGFKLRSFEKMRSKMKADTDLPEEVAKSLEAIMKRLSELR